ncbi:hypothetical protein L6M70_09215 [Klebsiella pneumoniae]|nr:hypothetical protein [Klebsiella pneumoniae]MBC4100649.1 hypothetical protein [Klebsiella pneumoniae]MCL3216301.1 hypothetical protein [Klebsiella pneumoniae]MCL3436014.1 hypothetical protein [Klebsiella pneumoniae]MCL3457199.1 hypothetical protein [Klebsiella pneumoniae]MCL3487553.1 hypothetical protein [Klebsiella pneumoniae]
MTKSTITRERIQRIIRAINSEAYDEEEIREWLSSDEIMELSRMALAAMDSEPVAFTEKHEISNMHATGLYLRAWPADRARNAVEGYTIPLYTTPQPISLVNSEPVAYIFKHPAGRLFWALTDKSNKGQNDVMPVYASPQPAPVVQCPFPCGWDNLNKLAIQDAAFVARGLVEGEPTTEAQRQAAISNNDRLLKVISACRAAMLASAQQSPGSEPATVPGEWIPVSEQKPDCWCLTCRPVTLNDMRFVVCPDCGNKRCPRANDHRDACTGSNEPGQEGSVYPAAQQEVK